MHAAPAQPSSSVERFRYQPELVPVGTLYHYRKSNTDGSNPAAIMLYIASHTHIEVIKVEQGSDVLAYVTAAIDWRSFSAEYLASWHILPDDDFNGCPVPPPGLLRAQAVGSLSQRDHTLRMWVPGGAGSAAVGHYPVHIYNFDLASLNVTFRHLLDPEQPLKVGIADPDWNALGQAAPDGGAPNIFRYKGLAQIVYLRDEPCHGVPCRRYALRGPGMGDQEGAIWVNRAHGHFERVEHPVPDNPSWDSFALELTDIGAASVGEWHALIAATRRRNNAALAEEPAE